MILEGPEKKVQKVKLSNTGSTLGTSFRDSFSDFFLQDVEKSESSNPGQIQAGKSTGWELFSS